MVLLSHVLTLSPSRNVILNLLLIHINKTNIVIYIIKPFTHIYIYISMYIAIGGQTAEPNRLTFLKETCEYQRKNKLLNFFSSKLNLNFYFLIFDF